MNKLRASIVKDLRILIRDRVGLLLMFAMPVLLVLVITSLQNNTFKLVNDHQVPMVVFNQDKGEVSPQFIKALDAVGMFKLSIDSSAASFEDYRKTVSEKDALVGLVLPSGFSRSITSKTHKITDKALRDLGLGGSTKDSSSEAELSEIELYYSPVLQESYRFAIEGALQSALQLIQNKQMLSTIYQQLGEGKTPPDLERQMVHNQIGLRAAPLTRDGSGVLPNATQHNVPAWTVFAMFFMVTSLGSNLVKDKLSGSFIRIKTMPSSYFIGIITKQLVYLMVAMAQVLVIFSLGIWLFPHIGLPPLNLPHNIGGLALVSIISGLCALSYALCIGVYSKSQEQANGFGAVSVVILAALGGILVPTFAMPESFRLLSVISPLHWCLESYYSLFLGGGNFQDVLLNLFPLIIMIVALQAIAFVGLKQKKLI